ncbi:MAG: hypothetical protein R3C53_07085 [Pirellulaceae bacterium]
MAAPEQEAADAFRQCLVNLATLTQCPEPTTALEMSKEFRAALLLYASESDDNKDCAQRLEIGRILSNYGRTDFGLKLQRTDIGISSVLCCAEGCPIPEQVSEIYPELTQAQWEACQRLATLVLSAFESNITPSEPGNTLSESAE